MCIVKVCGITTVGDARICGQNGVDYVGFNFCRPSPRYIQPELAAKIIAQIREEFPSMQSVGVFQNEKIENLQKIAALTAINMIQLHGDENSDYQQALQQHIHRPLIKAYRPPPQWESAALTRLPAEWILLDSYHPHKYGGTGIPLDQQRARKLMHILKGKKIILAGGINPSNVAEYLALGPYGIDLNSGVERKIGHKDAQKIAVVMTVIRGRP